MTTKTTERFIVTWISWDHNGSHHVTIVDTTPLPIPEASEAATLTRERRAVRDLARRSVSRPQAVKWTRLDRVHLIEHEGEARIAYEVTASRLDRSYR